MTSNFVWKGDNESKKGVAIFFQFTDHEYRQEFKTFEEAWGLYRAIAAEISMRERVVRDRAVRHMEGFSV